MLKRAFDATQFAAWMKEVDKKLEQLCGLSSDMLPDYAYADAFQAGEMPGSVAKAALKAAGEF